ncbi:MAG: hypothetical protein AAB229_10710 [Candidatus Hydrogenedentota bacterium]
MPQRFFEFGLVIFALAVLGCGSDFFTDPVPPAPAPAVTRAREAVFEERDDTGMVQWVLRAAKVEQESGIVRCDSIHLVVPPGSGRDNLRGLTAFAAEGTYAHAADTPEATLEKGYEMTMQNGWSAVGDFARWNGSSIVTRDSVTLSRPGSRIYGRDAVIHPSRNRIILHDVTGSIGDLTL